MLPSWANLNILATLDFPSNGHIFLEGKNLAKIKNKDLAAFRRDNLGFVFQDFNLLDTFSIRDNIALPLVLANKKYPEIDQVLSSSKKIADELVEQSLYESCFGRTEREITLEKDGEGNITKQVVKTKYIPPNVQAIQFWLSNRRTYGNHHAQRFPHQQEPVSHSSMIFRILLRIRRRTRQMNGMID